MNAWYFTKYSRKKALAVNLAANTIFYSVAHCTTYDV